MEANQKAIIYMLYPGSGSHFNDRRPESICQNYDKKDYNQNQAEKENIHKSIKGKKD